MREVPFSRVLYIEQDDFREVPPKGYFRLSPGKEVRLRYGYLVTCTDVVKDPATGAVVEVHCTCDPATRGGTTPDGRKVKSTIQWVSAAHARQRDVSRSSVASSARRGTESSEAHSPAGGNSGGDTLA